MNKKESFIRAVQILAPNDQFIHEAAERVQEEILPIAPGAAALDFIVAMQTWKKENGRTTEHSARRYSHPRHDDTENLLKNGREKCSHNSMGKRRSKIRLKDSVRVKSAEYWLKLGEPVQALLELQHLQKRSKKDPWVVKVFVSAMGADANPG